jgi:hypothetical protein
MNRSSANSITPLEPVQRTAARLVGFLYLFTNATAIFAFSARGKVIVSGDAARTAANVVASERLFRLGIASELITVVGVLVLVWGLFVILRPIDRNLVWLATFFRLAENFVLAFVTVLELAIVVVAKNPSYLQAFNSQQLQGLVYAFIRIYDNTFNVGFLFLGLGSAVFSHLWWKSRYIPRVLAGWGIFASSFMAVMSLALIVFPSLTKLGMSYMMPMGLYEFGLGFWLLIRGIREPSPGPGAGIS